MSVWSEDNDRLSWLIADDDWQAVELFIRECGSAELNLIWNPGSLQIEEARLDDACRLWHALRGEDDLPRYRSFEPESMKPLLGYFMVIEKVVESNDLTHRLYGSLSFRATRRTAPVRVLPCVTREWDNFSMLPIARPCTARNLCSRGTHRHLTQK